MTTSLLGLGAFSAGCSPPDEPEPKPEPKPEPPTPAVFRDISMSAGLPRASRECMAVRDFDGDGKVDLMLSPISEDEKSASLAVYSNKGDGTFSRIDIPTTIEEIANCTVGDYDNDGRPDVAVIDRGKGQIVLLHNDSKGALAFSVSALQLGDAPMDGQLFMLAFLDFDADGLLDLYAGTTPISINADSCKVTENDIQCHTKDDTKAGRPLLLRNTGAKGFVAAPALPGPHATFGWSVSTIDWDEDGAVDLFLSNDFTQNQLMHNSGGQFTDLLPSLGASVYNHGMGAAFADFNHDGRWDYYVADIGPDQVWMSTAPGQVADHTLEMGVADVTRTHVGWAPVADDFNNDSFDDVFVGNSIVSESMQAVADLTAQNIESIEQPVDDFLFVNAGGKSFVPQKLPFERAHSRSHVHSAVGDFDGDGLVDLIEGPIPLRLLHNETAVTNAHWLGVRLKGRASPVNAHGAVVSIEIAGAAAGRRAAEAHDGFGTSSEVLHFGLGRATEASSVRVLWPGGAVQSVDGPIAGDRILEIEQP